MYNEMVIIKLIQAMAKLVCSPPEIFRGKILTHFAECGEKMYERIKYWMELSKVVTPSTESKEYLKSLEGEIFLRSIYFQSQKFYIFKI